MLAAVLFALVAQGASVRSRAEAASRLEPAAACDSLEQLLSLAESGGDRAEILRLYHARSVAAAAPLSAEEEALLRDFKNRSEPIHEVFTSRLLLVLATEPWAKGARELGLIPLLDTAAMALSDLFATRATKIVGHRFVIFPERGKTSTTSAISRKLWIALNQWHAYHPEDYDVLFHEICHGFAAHHQAPHWSAGGFFEGFGDLAPLYVISECAALIPPRKQQIEQLRAGIQWAGESEYLRTRIPIEAIPSYTPSTALLLEAAMAGGNGKEIHWKTLRRIFADAASAPSPGVVSRLWPAQIARDLLRVLPTPKARALLRRWRLPSNRDAEEDLALHTERSRTQGAQYGAKEWASEGDTIVGSWRVLGPIPDPKRLGSALDPLDLANRSEFSAPLEFEGKRYEWHSDIGVDERGIVHLSSLPGGDAPSVFYLAMGDVSPVVGHRRLTIGSDDDCEVWVGGERSYVFHGERGTNPEDPHVAYCAPIKHGSTVVAQVVNRGGSSGFHLRTSLADPIGPGLRAELEASEEARRLGAVDYLASRMLPADLSVPTLTRMLSDRAISVRIAAAHGMGGIRNRADVVEALLDRWERATVRDEQEAIRAALEELTFENCTSAEAARKTWHRVRERWSRSWFDDGESPVFRGEFLGGWCSQNPGSYGGQCLGRSWGEFPESFAAWPMRVTRPGKHVLRVRLVAGAGGQLEGSLNRGARPPIPFRAQITPTSSWTDWRWDEIPLGILEPGWFRLVLRGSGSPDLDVVGLVPVE